MIRIMILAMDKNRGIGSSSSLSGLPWHIPSEMAYFKKMTTGNGINGRYAVVMGNATYLKLLSLREKHPVTDLKSCSPLVMKGRDVFVMSYENSPSHNTITSMDAIKDYDALFICGGKQVYMNAVADKMVDFVLVSEVHGNYECDVYMPLFEDKMKLLKTFDCGEFTVKAYKTDSATDDTLLKKLLAPLTV